ncbi:MAG: tetratricopeptide repeat protein [Alphaproteobacteria bacterium]
MPIRGFRLAFALAIGLAAQPPSLAIAAPMDDSAERAMRDADLAAGTQAAKAGRYDVAIGLLQRVLASDANNADAHNMLGFAHRKGGDLSVARYHYQQALTLEPDHKGALEYYGEWHLQAGDRPGAERLRARLAALCPAGCEELADLDAALAK